MTKEILYTYLGANGMVTTPVQLGGVPAMVTVRLVAASDKVLTDGKVKVDSVTVLESEVSKWSEVNP